MTTRYPSLDWKSEANEEVKLVRVEHPHRELGLELSLSPPKAQTLSACVLALARGEARELKLEFAGGWTLYWKLREEPDLRLLASHPEPEFWVGTLLLGTSPLETLARQLMQERFEISIEEFAKVHFLSNLSLKIKNLG